ncbi:ABC transporter ATP-binding protein [Tenacibaculum xiamenense]|uniref:ABC transporter ATP-binding protein n=1 Tax=Tenacibaculum xiamenense TaxID=1261553 RepID=UPI00389676FD
MNTLLIKKITKQYANGVSALNDVSLELKNGLFGLLGPNGAGKSSLMRTIATLQEPTSGTISFNGEDCIENPQKLRSQLGYLPQEFGVYPKVNAEDLLHHLAVLKGVVSKGERKEQVNALLEQTNLYGHRKKSVNTFSGGMRQRFGIAQALLGDPKLIIVDEPTAGLDPEERNRFLNLLSEIGENVIIILSTHIVEDVRDLCNNMAILNKGKIAVQGNPIELTDNLLDKTWIKTIKKSEIKSYKQNYHVLSTRLLAGKTQIQILSEENPSNGFNSYKPDLESVYFSYLNPILKS